MRSQSQQTNRLATFASLLAALSLCGASPQEGRSPRPQPQSPRDAGSSRPSSAPSSPSTPSATQDAPGTRDVRGPQNRASIDSRSLPSTGRVSRVNLYPGTRVIIPPAWRRCTVFPDRFYWERRDLQAEIQWLSRAGSIPVTPLGAGVESISDYSLYPAGWRAYGIAVPVGGTVQVEVQHPKIGWFRLMMVDKWGRPGPGMLQQLVAHQPVMLTYKNPNAEATAIYVIVDDPAWWSDKEDPYTLQVRRDWDAAKVDLSQVKMVEGLWGASPSVSAEFRRPRLSGPAVFPR